MGRSLLTRLRAAILATCFICAGIILPDLDAVLFHGAPSQEESRPHVEATGSGSCHAERCVLGAVLPQGQKPGTVSSDLVRQHDPETLLIPLLVSISSRSPSGTLGSRAPPVSFVS